MTMDLKSVVLLNLLFLAASTGGARAEPRDAAKDQPIREPDRVAIEQMTTDMLDAFDRRDAAAMADQWTEHGEFIRNDGEPIRGRTEIRSGYEEFFKTLKGKPKLEVQSHAIRFPSPEMAVTEETLRLRNDDGEVVASSWQQSVRLRAGGQWKLAVVRASDRGIGLDDSLDELAWLIGTWHAATNDRHVTITYEWDENKAFIRGNFKVTEGARLVERGTQTIAKDNAEGVIRWWLFQSDGGFGNGVWKREGNKWTIDVHGVTPDGRQLTASTICVQLDPNTFTWQAVNQALDGVPLADTQPIKVTRQAPAK